jgi:hypothetical protein
MILIIQVALGIVLGVLILRYLPQIVKGGLVIGASLAAIAVVILGVVYANSHWDVVSIALAGTAFLVLLSLIIQFTARGLGALFFAHLSDFRRSPRLQRCIRLVGIKRDLIFSDAPRDQMVKAAGDKIFVGLGIFAYLYLMAVLILWVLPGLLILKVMGEDSGTHPVVGISALVVAVLVPPILLAFWVRRAPPNPSDRP